MNPAIRERVRGIIVIDGFDRLRGMAAAGAMGLGLLASGTARAVSTTLPLGLTRSLLATVSGSLAETPLESVLETFAGISNSGTLRLTRGDERGKIVYQEGEILYVTIGMLSGTKALDRLFTWGDAQFEFRPEVEPMDGVSGRLPLAPAVLSAVVARDELAHLDLSGFDSDSTFSVDADRLEAVASTLDDIGREIAENARMGFPLGAMLDMLACSDARIYKTITEMIEAGVLAIIKD